MLNHIIFKDEKNFKIVDTTRVSITTTTQNDKIYYIDVPKKMIQKIIN